MISTEPKYFTIFNKHYPFNPINCFLYCKKLFFSEIFRNILPIIMFKSLMENF